MFIQAFFYNRSYQTFDYLKTNLSTCSTYQPTSLYYTVISTNSLKVMIEEIAVFVEKKVKIVLQI